MVGSRDQSKDQASTSTAIEVGTATPVMEQPTSIVGDGFMVFVLIGGVGWWFYIVWHMSE